jgi:Transcriptional Coactivator p15 (PC4)
MSTDLRSRAQSLRGMLPSRRDSRPPPEENGQRLATINRGKGEELRVNWSTYEGKPFLSIRQWNQNDDGQWWPDKARGVTIRIRELSDFAEALSQALDLAQEAASHHRQQRPAPDRRPARAAAQDFDEFSN